MDIEPKKIMIATPSYDGKLDSRFTISLIDTMRRMPPHWLIDIKFLCGDAFLDRARDTLLQFAVDAEADILVWIDADSYWTPEDFKAIIEAPYDFIGGLQRLKIAKPEVPIKRLPGAVADASGVLEVAGIGFTMTKMTSKCFETLHARGEPYVTQGRSLRSVFTSGATLGTFVGEDFNVCADWRSTGGRIYAHTKVKLGHVSYSTCYDFTDLDDPAGLQGDHNAKD